MKIVSWNVNGLRASIKSSGKNLKVLLDGLGADIICFQETKATRDQLDESTYTAEGYSGYFSFCKTRGGYSGVVTFCRDVVTPLTAEEGLTGALSVDRQDTVKCYPLSDNYTEQELFSLDVEGRSVITEHPMSPGERTLVVINVYCPMVEHNADNKARMDYKIKFYSALQERCKALEKAGKSVLVVGDLNCTREMKDSAYLQEDPELFDNHHPARTWIEQFVTSQPDHPDDCMLLDTFRYLNPTQDKAFTCWSTFLDCRKTNYGTRIDYILCSHSLSKTLVKADVWQHVEGSDHCPVFAEFDLTLLPSSTQPSLSSSHFTFGKQRKMSDFLSSTGSEPFSLKRGASQDTEPPPNKVRKTSSQSLPGKTSSKQSSQTLLSFAKPKTCSQPMDLSSKEVKGQGATDPQMCSLSDEKPLSGAWKNVFSGPPKAPLCKGHNEACVLRTVKKQGPNLNKQFWVCCRPHGSKSDPTSTCNFFKWAKEK